MTHAVVLTSAAQCHQQHCLPDAFPGLTPKVKGNESEFGVILPSLVCRVAYAVCPKPGLSGVHAHTEHVGVVGEGAVVSQLVALTTSVRTSTGIWGAGDPEGRAAGARLQR